MTFYVYKNKRKGKARKTWRGRYRLDGDAKPTEVALGCRDRQTALEKLREIVKVREQELAGILPPKPLREAAQRLLTDHLDDFTRDLTTRGRDHDYVYNLDKLVTRLLTECGWTYPKDVTADSFQAWRAAQTKAAKTLNEYLASINNLLNWMVRHGRLLANPLRGVEPCELRGKEQRVRRALTDDEVRRLLAVAGPRRIVYLMALLTGLRRGELAQLTWGVVHLEAPQPFLVVRAAISKNHKDACLLLHPELAQALRQHRPHAPEPTHLVFPTMPSMYLYKADLVAAGIPYLDPLARQADFHALRHTFGTRLSVAGVPPRTAMELMRHSDIRLTMKIYTDASLLPTAAAISQLPGFLVPAQM